MHVINWGEIYYTTMRRGGQSAANAIAADIRQMPIRIVDSTKRRTLNSCSRFGAGGADRGRNGPADRSGSLVGNPFST